MTTTNATKTLTHAQFIVARALARSYGHLWAGVPDETYDIEAIEAWSEEQQHPMLPGGIYCPFLMDNGNVGHVTGSGRLAWEITTSGNVRLEVYRPASCAPRLQKESAILVAAIDILNGPEDGNEEHFEFGEFAIGSTDREKTHEVVAGYDRPQVKTGWLPFNFGELFEEFLFERHVEALVQPLTALLCLKDTKELIEGVEKVDDETFEAMPANERWELSHRQFLAYKSAVIDPAEQQAEALLKPLAAIALPDPWYGNDSRPIEPQTFYQRDDYTDERSPLVVHHKGDAFPVETERAAVHAVLLLREQSGMSLIDAVKSAILSKDYRP